MTTPHIGALDAYTRAWTEPDPEVVRELVSRCWTEESEIIGPGYYFKGRKAVLDEIARFHREQSDYKVIMTSGFDTHGVWTRFTIAMVKPDGSRGHEGWDVVEQDSEGKIRRVISFWGPLPNPGQ